MAAFSPLAFAVAQASTTDNGLLFIETANGGSGSRYNSELSDLGDDVVHVLSHHDIAFVTDITIADAKAKLNKLASEYNDGSCLSFAAIFIKTNGRIETAWAGGQDGEAMVRELLSLHETL